MGRVGQVRSKPGPNEQNSKCMLGTPKIVSNRSIAQILPNIHQPVIRADLDFTGLGAFEQKAVTFFECLVSFGSELENGR